MSPEPLDDPIAPASTEAAQETERLVRGAQAGAREDFARLYERLAPSLYTWAELRVGPGLRPWLDPADLVQEVWLRALRAFRGFDPSSTSFRYWIFRVAKNALLEALRCAESRRGPARPGAKEMLAQVPDSVTAISRRLARREDLARFRAWVEALEERDRELVLQIGLEGLDHARVARRAGLQTKTVTKRWQRLRERLEESGQLLEILGD